MSDIVKGTVRECAVVGAPDAVRGNLVKATIVPYKYPRAITLVDSLPKTATGKVRRSVLRQSEFELAHGSMSQASE